MLFMQQCRRFGPQLASLQMTMWLTKSLKMTMLQSSPDLLARYDDSRWSYSSPPIPAGVLALQALYRGWV